MQSALPSGWKVIEAAIEVSSFSFVLADYIEANFRFKFGRGMSSEPRFASSVSAICSLLVLIHRFGKMCAFCYAAIILTRLWTPDRATSCRCF